MVTLLSLNAVTTNWKPFPLGPFPSDLQSTDQLLLLYTSCKISAFLNKTIFQRIHLPFQNSTEYEKIHLLKLTDIKSYWQLSKRLKIKIVQCWIFGITLCPILFNSKPYQNESDKLKSPLSKPKWFDISAECMYAQIMTTYNRVSWGTAQKQSSLITANERLFKLNFSNWLQIPTGKIQEA